MPRVVVLTADVLAAGVAGPAIRALAIADALAADVDGNGEPRHQVRLLSTASCDLSGRSYDVAFVPSPRLRAAVGDAEVLIVQGLATYEHPWLLKSEPVLVVDLYDPVLLEQLEQMTDRPLVARRATHDQTVRTVNDALVRGDFFLCASEGQRLFWLGQLAALGRFDPLGYDRDPSLRALIDVVPFGLPSHPPQHRTAVVKGVLPGIGPDDRLVLWAGGVYNWLDPLTLISAMALVRDRRPTLRLLFLGMKHPNPDTPSMRVAWETRSRSDALGLTGSTVFFNEGWVDYDQRQDYLLEADVGVSTHLVHVETTLSFRTRILDYLWAGLPIVATEGDGFGALIEADGLGVVVPEHDAAALAEALERCAYDDDFAAAARSASLRAAERYTWERALAPLLAFCRAPQRAADAGPLQRRILSRAGNPSTTAARMGLRAWDLWRQGGPTLVVERLRARRRRLRGG